MLIIINIISNRDGDTVSVHRFSLSLSLSLLHFLFSTEKNILIHSHLTKYWLIRIDRLWGRVNRAMDPNIKVPVHCRRCQHEWKRFKWANFFRSNQNCVAIIRLDVLHRALSDAALNMIYAFILVTAVAMEKPKIGHRSQLPSKVIDQTANI